MAFLNSATAPGRSDFSERATPSQLWASADRGPTCTARRNARRARGYSFRPQYARPSATWALGLPGSRATAASSWLTEAGAPLPLPSWAVAVTQKARTRRAERPVKIRQPLIRRDRAGEAATATWRRLPREETLPSR